MKKVLVGFFIGICFISIIAFRAIKYEAKKSTAEVEQLQGIYVFTDSKPVAEYKYLGTVKSTMGWSGQYQPVRDKLLKKIRKDFPDADGVILHFVNGGTDRADAIKFKE